MEGTKDKSVERV